MATKQVIPDWAKEESEYSGGSTDYEPCKCIIVDMNYFEKADPNNKNNFIKNNDNVIEIILGVEDGPYKKKMISVTGFAKTQKGQWACYPAYEGKPRPILRELLERVREFEGNDEEIRFKTFSPSELYNRHLIMEIKKIGDGESEEDGTYFIPQTDYQKKKDAEYQSQHTSKEDEVDVDDVPEDFGESAKKEKMPWEK